METASKQTITAPMEFAQLFGSEAFSVIQDVLASYLTAGDAVKLSLVCKALGVFKDRMIGRISNINTRLERFVGNPVEFRSQLGKYDGLMTGIFVLEIFSGSCQKFPYLDVYIRKGPNADGFTEYLEEYEGFKRETLKKNPVDCIHFRSNLQGVIRVTQTLGDPIHAILGNAQTTATLNLISWNKAYCIYPKETLDNHKCYMIGGDLCNVYWKELRSQGWRSQDMRWPDYSEGAKFQHPSRVRLVGDKYSFIVPLDTESIETPSRPACVVGNNQFILGRVKDASSAWVEEFYLDISGGLLDSVALQYSYTCSLRCRRFISNMLYRWSWLECYALETGDLPPDWRGDIPFKTRIEFPEGFEMPRCWKYADNFLPDWYKEWQLKEDRVFQ